MYKSVRFSLRSKLTEVAIRTKVMTINDSQFQVLFKLKFIDFSSHDILLLLGYYIIF